MARFASRHRILLIGSYRDVEVERTGPLADALGALPRETSAEHLLLEGLAVDEVRELLEAITDQAVPAALVEAISSETSGNPFFIREVLLHLVEEGKIFRREGRWAGDLAIEQMGIPEGVKQVIGRRLARLSVAANRLLTVAAAFTGGFRLNIAGPVAGLDEDATLSAADEALAAQLLRPGSDADRCDFTHALVRHTLYERLSPPRQVRLHREIAEAMEQVYGDASTSSGRDRLAEHAAEIAEQYHRSAALPGAERGVAHALVAADRAEAAAAHDEVVKYVRMALAQLPDGNPRRPSLVGRLGLALTWSYAADEALAICGEAGELIAAAEGNESAARYLAGAAYAMSDTGCDAGAFALARQGLTLRHGMILSTRS